MKIKIKRFWEHERKKKPALVVELTYTWKYNEDLKCKIKLSFHNRFNGTIMVFVNRFCNDLNCWTTPYFTLNDNKPTNKLEMIFKSMIASNNRKSKMAVKQKHLESALRTNHNDFTLGNICLQDFLAHGLEVNQIKKTVIQTYGL